ncbi:5-formyltetrahydrofolate cyclo-ligase [Buchnera aphidicola (Mindarus keteleerifoliae)]|uniref:5-formyltetrahydrofolate cyclo-ligase n=1 Tax=Buchnera aphidicola TaxID=9 RepID=UPI0031B715BE
MKNNVIRKNIRIKRRNLNQKIKIDAAIKVANLVFNFIKVKNIQNVALFHSFDGEIDTFPLANLLWKNNKKVFLPKINSFFKRTIYFLKYKRNTNLKLNKFNIFEPEKISKRKFFIDDLEMILVPLVAFDKDGNRLGMGFGFYDLLLRNWKKKKLYL